MRMAQSGGQWKITEEHSYNARLQPTSITDTLVSSGQTIRSLNLYYAGNSGAPATDGAENNGNLLVQTISGTDLPTAPAPTQGYTYDGANRIAGFAEGPCTRTFNYDTWGNMWVYPYSQTSCQPNPQFTPTSNVYDPATNRPTSGGFATFYMAGGENTIGGYHFTYDAENRMTSATLTATTVYLYDGDGRRAAKINCPTGTGLGTCGPSTTGAYTVWYAYDASGELAAEYGQSLTAAAPRCTTCYVMEDHLGSTRMMADQNGTLVAAHDYLPFGEEIYAGTNSRSSSYYPGNFEPGLLFTGKLRDDWGESGLDYFGARYFSGAQGRFTSVDPENRGGKVPDPQSWNGYAYGRNNPLLYTDPTGETYQICVTNDQGKNQCSSVSDDQFGQIQQNPGSGISLSNGNINAFVNGQWVNAGTYAQTDVDLPPGVGMALHAAGATADAEIKKFARDVAIGVSTGLVAGVVIGAAAEGIEALPRVLPFKNTDLIQRVSRALTRIGQGAKMYSRDGIPFQNREGLLPGQGPGYYTEYTVEPAAGGAGRGAERLVLGKGGEVYYTPNHYGSFVRVQ
jgi:RHS repeat-associated protein